MNRKEARAVCIRLMCCIVLGACIQFTGSGVLFFLFELFPQIGESYQGIVAPLAELTPQMLTYTIVVAPLIEEGVFRGAFLHLGMRVLPFWIMNLIQAVLFGMYHGNIIQGVYTFLCGLLFGYICKETNLVYVIIIHISLNAFGVYISNAFGEGVGMAFQLISFVIAAIIGVALTFLMIRREEDGEQ